MGAYLEIAAHSAYDMFSEYKYLIVNLVFSHLGFWSGNFSLFAPSAEPLQAFPFVTYVSWEIKLR